MKKLFIALLMVLFLAAGAWAGSSDLSGNLTFGGCPIVFTADVKANQSSVVTGAEDLMALIKWRKTETGKAVMTCKGTITNYTYQYFMSVLSITDKAKTTANFALYNGKFFYLDPDGMAIQRE